MYLSREQFKEEITSKFDFFINGFVDVLYKKFEEEKELSEQAFKLPKERIMTAKEVCAYYGNFSNSTLNRHEKMGLRRMPSRKNVNRMFRFSECERYFNKKK